MKITVHVLIMILLGWSFFARGVNYVYAAELACPADWTTDSNSYFDDPLTPQEDGWHDFKDFSFNYTFNRNSAPFENPTTGSNQPIDVTVTTDIPGTAFTRIFANFMNVLYPFVLEGDAEIQAVLGETTPGSAAERWMRIYCISGTKDEGTQTGSVSLKLDADLTAEVIVPGRYRCESPPDANLTCPAGSHDNPGTCTSVGCRAVQDDSISEETQPVDDASSLDTQTFSVPYRLSLRDIAQKAAYTIKEQYCYTSKPDSCMSDIYACIPEGELIPGTLDKRVMIPDTDPAANGKDGMCYLKEEVLTATQAEIIARRMCTNMNFNQVVEGTLNSKICHYSGPLVYTPTTSRYLRSEISIDDNEQTVNQIPFDMGLFEDNGETVNPNCFFGDGSAASVEDCFINGYYRRALQDRLSRFTPADKSLFDTMKYRIQVANNGAQAYDVEGTGQNYGAAGLPDAWTFDYIERLGGVALMSEEARIFNPDLHAAGDRVVAEDGSEVYLRGGQVFYNNFVISNRQRVNSQFAEIANSSPVAVDDFNNLLSAISGLYKGFQEGLFQDDFDRLLPTLRLEQSKEVFRLYFESLRTLRAYTDECTRRIEEGSYIGDLQACLDESEPVRTSSEAFNAAYTAFREEYGVQNSNFNPTLDCNTRNRCLITFVSGNDIFAAFTPRNTDPEVIIQLPLQGQTFNQISHRAFITNTNQIVVVYSDIQSNTYRIMLYNPYGPAYESTVVTLAPGEVDFLGEMDAYYNELDNTLHVGFYNKDETAVKIRAYSLNNNAITEQGGQVIDMGGRLFTYFRPGPHFSFTMDTEGNYHVVAVVWGESPDEFVNALHYARVHRNGGAAFTTPVVTNAFDKTSGRIPNRAEVGASRLLSNNGKSIYVDPTTGLPIVVYINRVKNDAVERTWEIYYQAYVAVGNLAGPWTINPISDFALATMSEIRNVFIAPGYIGMTVNDTVTKRDSVSRMWDSAGAKRCIYTGLQAAAVLRSGSTDCASTANKEYVMPFGGNWVTRPITRPQ